MSIQIPITKQELRQLKKQLRRQREIVCLDTATYIKTRNRISKRTAAYEALRLCWKFYPWRCEEAELQRTIAGKR